MTTRPAWVPLNLGLNARQSGCVGFFVNADTLYDGYVTFDGRTVGYLQDWGSDGCLFIPCITMCEDEHPRPLEADSIETTSTSLCTRK